MQSEFISWKWGNTSVEKGKQGKVIAQGFHDFILRQTLSVRENKRYYEIFNSLLMNQIWLNL